MSDNMDLKVLLNPRASKTPRMMTSSQHLMTSHVNAEPEAAEDANAHRKLFSDVTLSLPGIRRAPVTQQGGNATLSSAGKPRSRQGRRGSKPSKALSPVEEEYELHEYEWPDLPPLEQIRAALARGNISQGVRYLLPVDKTRNSVDGKFRTDLRKMFKRQYVNDLESYDEGKVRDLARFHFSTNSPPTDKRPKAIELHPREVPINQESHKVRLAYCKSAPSNGLVGQRTTEVDLQPRSCLHFPLKQKIPEEAVRLKKEADRILKSVQEKEIETPDFDATPQPHPPPNERGRSRRYVTSRQRVTSTARAGVTRSTPTMGTRRKSKFETYDDFVQSKTPKRRELPEKLRNNNNLSNAKCERVWDWLNQDEKITDFSYFLEVCS